MANVNLLRSIRVKHNMCPVYITLEKASGISINAVGSPRITVWEDILGDELMIDPISSGRVREQLQT